MDSWLLQKDEQKMFDDIIRHIKAPFFRLKYGSSLCLDGTLIRRSRFYIPHFGNSIKLGRLRMFDSKFFLFGKNNSVSIDDTSQTILNLSVKIYGDDNTLEIKRDAAILGLRIVIRGEGCRVIIGKHFSGNINCMMTCMGKGNYIEVGDDCMLSENIDIWNTDSHQITDTNGRILNDNKPIVIGNHVWIGKDCSILKGVTIGTNSIIGMSSVVTSNVDAHSIYVGNPARKVKESISWKRDFMD